MTNTMRLLGGAGITALFLLLLKLSSKANLKKKDRSWPAAGAHLRLGLLRGPDGAGHPPVELDVPPAGGPARCAGALGQQDIPLLGSASS